jgi:cell division inhibitor SepF
MSVADIFKEFFRPSDIHEEQDRKAEYQDGDEDSTEMESLQRENLTSDHRYLERNSSVEQSRINMNKNNATNNVIGLPGLNNNSAEVMVIEPQSFGEMPKVIDALRDKKSVVLNLENMDAEIAQRSVDFVTGGTYAMDGHYERVGDSIFLFTPSCVTVSNLSGLVSAADDFANARNRRPSNKPLNNPVDFWPDASNAAQ